jgi:hypothetical protein
MLMDVDTGRQWVFMWGQLQAFRLDVWVKREHWEKGQDPVRSIVVDRVSADIWVSLWTGRVLISGYHCGQGDC